MARVVRRFFENPKTGRLVIWQWPNPPLWVYIATVILRRFVHSSVVAVIGTLALVVWAVLEVTRGESPFRRVLGGVVLLGVVLGVVMRLS